MTCKSYALLGAASTIALMPAAALAQENEGPEAAEDNGNVIIVTANQRETELQEVPIAVTAFDGALLEQSGVTEVRDLVNIAPSFNYSSSQNASAGTTLRIRGVGTTVNANPGFESAVGVFIDDVYQSRAGIALGELYDVEQVEVLRGPQGTLFGRNTSVGALTIRTKAPDLSGFEGSAAVTYGNFDMINLQGMINTPVSDTLGFRFAGSYRERDDWLTSSTGADSNGFQRFMLRGQALWEPTPDISVRIIGDYSEADTNCCAPVILTESPAAPLLFAAGVLPFDNIGDNALDNNLGNDNGRTDDSDQWGITGRLDWDLGGATLTYVGAYRDFYSEQTGDLDFAQQRFIEFTPGEFNFTEIKTMTHELRLQGTAFSDRLDWLVGAYYSDEDIRFRQPVSAGPDLDLLFNGLIFATLASAPPNDPFALGPNPIGVFTGGVPLGGATSDNLFLQEAESFSIFTHNILEVADGLFLTIGARYVDEKKDASLQRNGTGGENLACLNTFANTTTSPLFFNGTPLDPTDDGPLAALAPLGIALTCPGFATPLDTAVFPGLPTSHETSFSDDEFIYTGNIRYEFNPDLSAYVSYTHGFKSGGISLDTSAAAIGLDFMPSDPRFNSETVDSIEVGLKGVFANGDVQANIAIYDMDIEDLQLASFNGLFFSIFNVPKSRSRGVEFDFNARVSDEFSFNGALNYNDASFPDDCAPPSFPADVLANCGLAFQGAPEWVATLGGNFQKEFGTSGIKLSVAPFLRFETDSLTQVGNDINPSDDAVTFDMRVGIGDVDDGWALEFWGRNIFDERIFTQSSSAPGRTGSRDTWYKDPRTYGVTARFNF